MSRILPHPWVSAGLFAAWFMLWRDFGAAHLVAASLAALLLPRIALDPGRIGVPLRRPGLAARLAAVVLVDIVTANFAVARLALSPRPLRPAWVAVPLEMRDDYGVSLLATIVTMTPGTVSVEIAPSAAVLYVHVLDTDDAAAVAAAIKRRYEGPIKEMLAC